MSTHNIYFDSESYPKLSSSDTPYLEPRSPDKRVPLMMVWDKFLFLSTKTCYGYLLEFPCQGNSAKYQWHILWMRNKEIYPLNTPLRPFIRAQIASDILYLPVQRLNLEIWDTIMSSFRGLAGVLWAKGRGLAASILLAAFAWA